MGEQSDNKDTELCDRSRLEEEGKAGTEEDRRKAIKIISFYVGMLLVAVIFAFVLGYSQGFKEGVEAQLKLISNLTCF